MVAEIISIGTEILMGNITNTNAVYFASPVRGAWHRLLLSGCGR